MCVSDTETAKQMEVLITWIEDLNAAIALLDKTTRRNSVWKTLNDTQRLVVSIYFILAVVSGDFFRIETTLDYLQTCWD